MAPLTSLLMVVLTIDDCFMMFVQCERVTLWFSSLKSNTTKWTLYGPPGGTTGSIVKYATCPSGSSCFQYSKHQGLFRYDSTVGYKDIEISYSIRSNGLTDIFNANQTIKEYCDLRYIVGTQTTAWNAWHFVNPAEGDRANNATITHHYPLSGAHNTSIVGVLFDANIGVNDTCWLNDVSVTGIHYPSIPISTTASENEGNSSQNDLFSVQNILIASFAVILIAIIALGCILRVLTRRGKQTDATDPVEIQIEGPCDNIVNTDEKINAAPNDAVSVPPNSEAVMNETHENEEMDAHEDSDDNIDQIRLWLTKKVQLPQYLDHFVSNGFDQLCFIKDINSKSQLKEIGIEKIGHQMRVWKYVLLLAEEGSDFSMEIETTLRDDKLYSTPSGQVPGSKAMLSTMDMRLFASMAKYDPVIRGTIGSLGDTNNSYILGSPPIGPKVSIGSIGSFGSLPSEVTETRHACLSVASTEQAPENHETDVADHDSEIMEQELDIGTIVTMC